MPLIQFSPSLKAAFERRKIFLGRDGAGRIPLNTPLTFDRGCALESYSQIFNGHVLPYRMGAFSYAHCILAPNLFIGRYCSISGDIAWGGEMHPMDWVSSYPLTYGAPSPPALEDFFKTEGVRFEREDFASSVRPMRLGNDVWIGAGAFIGSGVRIGDGAVVAARAVVTKDVSPYAIVGGVPAKVIRMRFSEDVAARLLASAWWRYNPADVAPLRLADPIGFLDRLEARVAEGAMRPAEFGVLTGGEMIAAVTSPPEG